MKYNISRGHTELPNRVELFSTSGITSNVQLSVHTILTLNCMSLLSPPQEQMRKIYIKNTKFEVCRINKNETKLFKFFSCEFFSFLLWEDNMVVAVYLALGVAPTTAQSQTSHHSNE